MLSLQSLRPSLFQNPKPIILNSHTQLHRISTCPQMHHVSPLEPHQQEPAKEVEKKVRLLPSGLKSESIPKHIAVILDGNRRWARENGWPTSVGHTVAYRTVRKLIGRCTAFGVKVLTVFAFSQENWNRSEKETEFFMSLCERKIKAGEKNLMRDNIRVSFLRDSSKLPDSLNESMTNVENATKNNTGLHLMVVFSYSGRYDIMQACQNIAYKVKDNLIQPEGINEDLIEQELGTSSTEFPSIDLLIRTSGELRLSNFLLWQLAYTELFFTQSLWPDFGEIEFIEAVSSYQQRKRRYGGDNS